MKTLRTSFTSCDDFANYVLDSVLDFGSKVTPEFNALTGLNMEIDTDIFSLKDYPAAGENFKKFGSARSWLYDIYELKFVDQKLK